jgi:threonine/homoserine/homoserine lactone efflux protein
MAPTPPEQYPMQPPPRNDNTTLFGLLGIVLAICFWPAGILCSILAIRAAARVGKPRTLGLVGLCLCGLAIIIFIIRVVAIYG